MPKTLGPVECAGLGWQETVRSGEPLHVAQADLFKREKEALGIIRRAVLGGSVSRLLSKADGVSFNGLKERWARDGVFLNDRTDQVHFNHEVFGAVTSILARAGNVGELSEMTDELNLINRGLNPNEDTAFTVTQANALASALIKPEYLSMKPLDALRDVRQLVEHVRGGSGDPAGALYLAGKLDHETVRKLALKFSPSVMADISLEHDFMGVVRRTGGQPLGYSDLDALGGMLVYGREKAGLGDGVHPAFRWLGNINSSVSRKALLDGDSMERTAQVMFDGFSKIKGTWKGIHPYGSCVTRAINVLNLSNHDDLKTVCDRVAGLMTGREKAKLQKLLTADGDAAREILGFT